MAAVRVGILSATLGSVPDSFLLPTGQALAAVGRNTGNLAFRYAVNRHITSPTVHVPWGSDPGWVRGTCDLLAIPSANQANPAEDFSHRASFLEAVDLPCLALGLGAQAPALGAGVNLQPGTVRYLRALSERSRRVGVRGTFTADVLDKVGVRNVVVIGCPSNFINPLPTLGATIEAKLRQRVVRKLAVTAGDLTPAHRSLERKLLAWLANREGAYICQSHPGLVSLARHRPDEVTRAEADLIRRYLRPLGTRLQTRAEFLATVRRWFRVFFDAGAWLEFLASFDLAVGPRIHGNLLAVQAGTPGVCVSHDGRTQELCDTIALPVVSVERAVSARGPRDLAELTAFDGGRYDRTRAALAREYCDLLGEHGVRVSDALHRLAGDGVPAAPQG